jgi:signal transduction histidine kinase
VTKRKLAEREASTRDLQRTQSIGTLAIGIAHDFNNIIAAILGNVVLGRQDIEEGQSALRALEQIDHAAIRARGLVQQILAYARRQPQAFSRQPLARLIQASVVLLRAALPSGVKVNAELEAGALDVFADAGQLNQVLLNLGTNSWHAMEGRGGRIDIRLSAISSSLCEEPTTAVTHALLEVTDDGAGMDEITLAHLFDPYFTTKPIGQGTGLGLSVVWGIVKAHGATITVESSPGAGARFSLIFPVM